MLKRTIYVASILAMVGMSPACTWIGDDDLAARMDLDGDGEPGLTDCDDNDPNVQLLTWYADSDNDGFGSTVNVAQCAQPEGYVAAPGDCDDGDVTINPAQEEVCNGVDDDCNTAIDDSLEELTLWPDEDEDGYGDPDGETHTDCAVSDGYSENDLDCDDDDPDVGDEQTYYPDADGDGYGDLNTPEQSCADLTKSGFTLEDLATDCDDNREDINPDQPEICDDENADEDCDGLADDEDAEGAYFEQTWYSDSDGDGYGAAKSTPRWSCDGAEDEVDNKMDCDDGNPKNGAAGCAWKTVATGKKQTCALSNMGYAECWGEGDLETPPEAFDSIKVGDRWACGLARDGSLECWSDNLSPAADIPTELVDTRVVALAAGFTDACAATSVGSVVCWGEDETLPEKAPQGYYEALSAYDDLFCGTRAEDGEVDCWGPDWEEKEEGIPIVNGTVDFGESVEKVSAGGSAMSQSAPTVCAITPQNANPDQGKQVRCFSEDSELEWALDEETSTIEVSVGGALACTITSTHALSCVTGQSHDRYTEVPEAPEGSYFTRVWASYNHGCVITDQGGVGCWGTNSYGQTDVPQWTINE